MTLILHLDQDFGERCESGKIHRKHVQQGFLPPRVIGNVLTGERMLNWGAFMLHCPPDLRACIVSQLAGHEQICLDIDDESEHLFAVHTVEP